MSSVSFVLLRQPHVAALPPMNATALLLLVCLLQGIAGATTPRVANTADDAAAAARRLYALTGAFSNEGHTLRDATWRVQLKPNEARVLQVNLYAGNTHWFCAATAGEGIALQLALYDENGRALPAGRWSDNGLTAAHWTAEYSGPHYLRIVRSGVTHTNDSSAVDALILYTFK